MRCFSTRFHGWILTATLATLAIGCAPAENSKTPAEIGNQTDTTADVGNTENTDSTDKSTYQMGEPIEVKMAMETGVHFITTVEGVREFVATDPLDRPSEGNRWLIANITVESQGSDPFPFSGQEFTLVDREGNTYEASVDAEVVADAKTLYNTDAVEDKLEGEVGFEVPISASGLKLLFDPSLGECETTPEEWEAMGLSCDRFPIAVDANVTEDPNAAKSGAQAEVTETAMTSQASKEGATFLGSLARGQQAYHLENQQFATTIEDLQLGIESETKNYSYAIVSADSDRTHLIATAKNQKLKSYAALVFVGDAGFSKNIVCATDKASQTPPAVPQVSEDEASCPSGSSKV